MDKKLMIKVLKRLEEVYPEAYHAERLANKLKIPDIDDGQLFKVIKYLKDTKKITITYKNDSHRERLRQGDKISIRPEGIDFLNKEINRKTQYDLRNSMYILTIVLAIAAAGSFSISYRIMMPKLVGPVFSCPKYIGGGVNDTTQLMISFGNYGDVPTNMRFDWQGNNIIAFNTYSEIEIERGFSKSFPITGVYIPVKYQDNKQTTFSIVMKIENKNITTTNFSLTWRDSEIFDFLFPVTVKCNYEKIDENFILK